MVEYLNTSHHAIKCHKDVTDVELSFGCQHPKAASTSIMDHYVW
jgi:hypothetical protein